jgi:hypothetical protein
MKLPREDWNIKMGRKLIEKNIFTLSLIFFALSSMLLISTKAQALFYCVGCNGASAGTCTGGGAGCTAPAGNCDSGTNGVVCNDISEALNCIDQNDDTNATIKVAQGTHEGPGSDLGDIINNLAGANQTIQILGGWSSSNCGSQTLNPSNTIIKAPTDDRVFRINNTTNFPLNVKLEGITITGGEPNFSVNCIGGESSGGGVCVTSTGGTGGVVFTSSTNIYDANTATNNDGSGGGLAIVSQTGGDITATTMGDTFTNNSAGPTGGAILLRSFTNTTLDVSIADDIIGGDSLFPNGGNEAGSGGGIEMAGLGGELNVTLLGGNEIKNNSATAVSTLGLGGGGIRIGGGAGPPVSVAFEGDSINHDRIIFNEAASTNGGGILIGSFDATATANVSINRAEIGNNVAGESGGGIYLIGSGSMNLNPVVNNVIHNNIALGSPSGGGGVAAVTLDDDANFDIKFVNNTISDNQAPTAGAIGGAIFADSSADTGAGVINWTLPNDIIYFNTAGGDGDQVALANTGDNATLAIRFSDIRQGVGNTDIVGLGSGGGFVNLVAPNFDADPLFVDRFNNNYRIQADSPIADAGTKTAIATVAGAEANPPSEDFDGVPRDISIGAFEPSPSPTPTPTGSPTPTPIPCTTDDACPAGFICSDFVEPDMGTCIPGCTVGHPCPTGQECEIPAGSDQGTCVVPTPTPTPTPTPPGTPTPTPPPPTPPNIQTFPNAKNGKLVTIESEDGTILSDVKPLSKKLDGCPEGFNGQFLSFPIGSYQYVVSGINPGDETTVLIDLPPGTILNTYFKFGPTPDNPKPHCYEFLFDGQTGAQIFADNVVVHHIDGARGDDDLTPNGVIVDPAAPALLSEEPPGTQGNGCSIAQTASTQIALLNLLIPLLPALVVGLRSLRRKKGK